MEVHHDPAWRQTTGTTAKSRISPGGGEAGAVVRVGGGPPENKASSVSFPWIANVATDLRQTKTEAGFRPLPAKVPIRAANPPSCEIGKVQRGHLSAMRPKKQPAAVPPILLGARSLGRDVPPKKPRLLHVAHP